MKISRGIKKVLLLVLALSLAIGMFSLPATVTADSSDDSGVFDVYHPSYGVACYPRMFTTSKGSVLCAFDTNDEGGRGKIKLTRSSDNGKTWATSGQIPARQFSRLPHDPVAADHPDAAYAGDQFGDLRVDRGRVAGVAAVPVRGDCGEEHEHERQRAAVLGPVVEVRRG